MPWFAQSLLSGGSHESKVWPRSVDPVLNQDMDVVNTKKIVVNYVSYDSHSLRLDKEINKMEVKTVIHDESISEQGHWRQWHRYRPNHVVVHDCNRGFERWVKHAVSSRLHFTTYTSRGYFCSWLPDLEFETVESDVTHGWWQAPETQHQCVRHHLSQMLVPRCCMHVSVCERSMVYSIRGYAVGVMLPAGDLPDGLISQLFWCPTHSSSSTLATTMGNGIRRTG